MDSQTSSDPIQCANGCGFFGNPSTESMCSKCYREVTALNKEKEAATEQARKAAAAFDSVKSQPSSAASAPSVPPKDDKADQPDEKCSPCATQETATAAIVEAVPKPVVSEIEVPEKVISGTSKSKAACGGGSEDEPKPKKKVQKNKKRCFECRKKIGLTALECKCGFVFCNLHRFPDQHACEFDFKTHDRDNLAKNVLGGGTFSKMQKL